MMRLLQFKNYELEISPEILVIKRFKKIWDRDSSEDKIKAKKDFGFIYHYCDPRSDYQYIIDDEERMDAVKDALGYTSTWKPDKALQDAMDYYNTFKTTSALLLEDTKAAVEKLRLLLRDIDLNAVDDKGKPLYTLNTITSTIKQIPSLVKDLDVAERTLSRELEEETKMRGKAEKTLLDDDLDSI